MWPTIRRGLSSRVDERNPPLREYFAAAWVLKVDCEGKLHLHGHKWQISKALCGKRVQLMRLEDLIHVYYCNTLIRELDLDSRPSS